MLITAYPELNETILVIKHDCLCPTNRRALLASTGNAFSFYPNGVILHTGLIQFNAFRHTFETLRNTNACYFFAIGVFITTLQQIFQTERKRVHAYAFGQPIDENFLRVSDFRSTWASIRAHRNGIGQNRTSIPFRIRYFVQACSV